MEIPKLSQFTKVLATPEEYFENTVKSALNIEIPPGPMSMILKVQTALEKGELPAIERILPAVKPPKLQEILASIPKLPELPPVVEAPRAEVVASVTQKKEAVVF